MNYRIEISPLPQWRDARGEGVKKQVEKFFGYPVEKVWSRDVYTVSASLTEPEVRKVASLLYNPVLQDGVPARPNPRISSRSRSASFWWWSASSRA